MRNVAAVGSGSGRTAAMAFFIAVAVLAGWVVATSYRFIAADWYSLEARSRIARAQELGAKPMSAQEWVRLQAAMKRAIEVTPGNAMLHDYMAALFVLRGQQAAKENPKSAALYFVQARHHLQISVELRPSGGRSWASLASARQALGEPVVNVLAAAQQAAYHSPVDPQVQRVVLPMVMANWNAASAELHGWAKRLYADEPTRKRIRMDEMAKKSGLSIATLQ